VTHYVIRGGVEGKHRLEVLARTMWPSTSRLLERSGLTQGMTCLDLGCGGGDVTLELARWIGRDGEVTGLDMDKTKLDLAREAAAVQGLRNTYFRESDIGQWNETSQYDLVYCRFQLTHLRDPVALLRRMWNAVRLGGRVVIEDVDFAGSFCHPACTAFDRYVDLYRRVVASRGGDADIGPRLYGLVRDSGWQNPNLDLVQPAFAAGEGKRVMLLTLVNIAEAVLAEGLARDSELQGLIDEFTQFTEADDTIVGLPQCSKCGPLASRSRRRALLSYAWPEGV